MDNKITWIPHITCGASLQNGPHVAEIENA